MKHTEPSCKDLTHFHSDLHPHYHLSRVRELHLTRAAPSPPAPHTYKPSNRLRPSTDSRGLSQGGGYEGPQYPDPPFLERLFLCVSQSHLHHRRMDEVPHHTEAPETEEAPRSDTREVLQDNLSVIRPHSTLLLYPLSFFTNPRPLTSSSPWCKIVVYKGSFVRHPSSLCPTPVDRLLTNQETTPRRTPVGKLNSPLLVPS